MPPPRQLAHNNVGREAKTVIDSIRLIQSQISNIQLCQKTQGECQDTGQILGREQLLVSPIANPVRVGSSIMTVCHKCHNAEKHIFWRPQAMKKDVVVKE